MSRSPCPHDTRPRAASGVVRLVLLFWTGILWGLIGVRFLPLGRGERAAGEPPHHLVAEPLTGMAAFGFGRIVRLMRVLGHRSFPSRDDNGTALRSQRLSRHFWRNR